MAEKKKKKSDSFLDILLKKRLHLFLAAGKPCTDINPELPAGNSGAVFLKYFLFLVLIAKNESNLQVFWILSFI